MYSNLMPPHSSDYTLIYENPGSRRKLKSTEETVALGIHDNHQIRHTPNITQLTTKKTHKSETICFNPIPRHSQNDTLISDIINTTKKILTTSRSK